jgi:TM2 domain-containing membrane protein YozV
MTQPMTQAPSQTHTPLMGYILWIFGFIGAHRFYYGKPVTGTIYFFTLGIFLIGWLVDLFLIPSMNREADIRFHAGTIDYNLAWILLTFLGLLGIHRLYMGKWISGLIYLLTGGIFGLGYIYDFWTLNDQISLLNGSNYN